MYQKITLETYIKISLITYFVFNTNPSLVRKCCSCCLERSPFGCPQRSDSNFSPSLLGSADSSALTLLVPCPIHALGHLSEGSPGMTAPSGSRHKSLLVSWSTSPHTLWTLSFWGSPGQCVPSQSFTQRGHLECIQCTGVGTRRPGFSPHP